MPEGAGRCLHFSQLRLGNNWIGRVDQRRNGGCRGEQFAHQFQPLRRNLHVQLSRTCHIATRSVQIGDKARRTGSLAVVKTIGIVVFAAFAVSAAGVLVAAITATCRRTRSAIKAGNRSYWPSAQRYSIATLRPSSISGFSQALPERTVKLRIIGQPKRRLEIRSPASPAAARAPPAAT